MKKKTSAVVAQPENRSTVMTLRVPVEMRDAIVRHAKDEYRTTSAMAVVLLREALERRGKA